MIVTVNDDDVITITYQNREQVNEYKIIPIREPITKIGDLWSIRVWLLEANGGMRQEWIQLHRILKWSN